MKVGINKYNIRAFTVSLYIFPSFTGFNQF